MKINSAKRAKQISPLIGKVLAHFPLVVKLQFCSRFSNLSAKLTLWGARQ